MAPQHKKNMIATILDLAVKKSNRNQMFFEITEKGSKRKPIFTFHIFTKDGWQIVMQDTELSEILYRLENIDEKVLRYENNNN